METKSFLQGIFYASYMMYNNFHSDIQEQHHSEGVLNQICIITNSGEKIIFAVNRGICPVGGCVPYAHTNLEDSLFDIAKNWCSEKIWNSIADSAEYNEVRAEINPICALIDAYGGIDIDKTTENYKKHYS